MKITQTNTSLDARQSGMGPLIAGIIIIIVGIILAFALNGLPSTDSNGRPTPLPSWAFGVITAVIGGLVLLLAQRVQVHLDKAGESFIETKRSVFAPKHQAFQLSSVMGVRFVATTSISSGGAQESQPTTRSTVTLVFNNGTYLDVLQSGGGLQVNMGVLGIFRKAPLRDEAAKIAEFIGVPLEANDFSSIGAAVSTISGLLNHDQPQMSTATVPTPTQPIQTAQPQSTMVNPAVQPTVPVAPTQPVVAQPAPVASPSPQQNSSEQHQ